MHNTVNNYLSIKFSNEHHDDDDDGVESFKLNDFCHTSNG